MRFTLLSLIAAAAALVFTSESVDARPPAFRSFAPPQTMSTPMMSTTPLRRTTTTTTSLTPTQLATQNAALTAQNAALRANLARTTSPFLNQGVLTPFRAERALAVNQQAFATNAFLRSPFTAQGLLANRNLIVNNALTGGGFFPGSTAAFSPITGTLFAGSLMTNNLLFGSQLATRNMLLGGTFFPAFGFGSPFGVVPSVLPTAFSTSFGGMPFFSPTPFASVAPFAATFGMGFGGSFGLGGSFGTGLLPWGE